MSELDQIFEALKKPEYVHVLLNPLPVYATAMGALALLIAVIMRSKQAQVVALVLVLVGCASVWPVIGYGERGADRVKSISNADGEKWLEAHEDRAEDFQYVFYLTAILAVACLVSMWKFPKAAMPLVIVTLVLAVACVAAGGWIGHAGGQVRHTEFRTGPPPAGSGEHVKD